MSMIIKSREGVDLLIDDDSYQVVKSFKWYIHIDGEPIANIKINGSTFRIKLKSVIMSACRTERDVYYINKNPLDNRKENLSFTKSSFKVYENYAEMISSCGKHSTKIDLNMIGVLKLYDWKYKENGYVYLRYDNKYMLLHRFIMNIGYYDKKDRIVVDHINGDTSDNRIDNLRVCHERENNRNKRKQSIKNATSPYKGLTWRETSKTWYVRVIKDKNEMYRAHFTNELAAASSYNHHARLIHGEFALVNDIEELTKHDFIKYLHGTEYMKA